MPANSDKVQIGLTPAGNAALEQVMLTGLFATEGDAYKLAVAYALGAGLDLSAASEGGYGTKFNARGGLDRDGMLRDVVVTLMPEAEDRPYATAEKLAELGLTHLARRLADHESLADVLSALQPHSVEYSPSANED